jgi:hypothetical protein
VRGGRWVITSWHNHYQPCLPDSGLDAAANSSTVALQAGTLGVKCRSVISSWVSAKLCTVFERGSLLYTFAPHGIPHLFYGDSRDNEI